MALGSVDRQKATRRSIAALIPLTVVLAAALFAFSRAGTWLVVGDPLLPARAAVVFGGSPFRAIEAAKIYQGGWAHEIWLTQGMASPDDVALSRLGIERTPEYEYNRQVLVRLGVPSTAIRVLNRPNRNTADEVQTVAAVFAESGGDRVILVTSKYHTRRVRALWHRLIGAHPEAIVRYTPDDPFEPERWWHNTTDAMAVARECFGLLNASLGFPVKSER